MKVKAKVVPAKVLLINCPIVSIELRELKVRAARKLQMLGHAVRLMPPSYVKAYVKRSKNDANDAAAICEAVTRPSMRFVPTKSEQQQSALMLHRSRQLLVRQRTMLSNAIRGHMAEFGVISVKGRNGTAELLAIIANEADNRIPAGGRLSLVILARQYIAITAQIAVVIVRAKAESWYGMKGSSGRSANSPAAYRRPGHQSARNVGICASNQACASAAAEFNPRHQA